MSRLYSADPRRSADGSHCAAAAFPVFLSCSAVQHATTREWAQAFLPDAVTLVPFSVAAVLSTALVCVLPAVWVCQRKPEAPSAGEIQEV